MCGRYTLASPDPAAVRARFPIGDAVDVRRRYNIAPGDDVLALTADRDGSPRGELLRWGLVPQWAPPPDGTTRSGRAPGVVRRSRAPATTGRVPAIINARAETVTQRPAFRGRLERCRCLIVADGFYEWSGHTGAGASRQAFHITRLDGEPFAFAGLWASRGGERAGERLRSCAILTTAANSAIAPLHDRMPVILPADAEALWLDPAAEPAELIELLAPLPASQTAVRAVGPAVNDARCDGPECLAAAVQATLF